MSTLQLDSMFAPRYAVEQYQLMCDEIVESAFAMDCRDCEDFIQHGIDAYELIVRFETVLREADSKGKFDFSSEVRDSCDALYKAWQRPCAKANQWIASNSARGFIPDNLERFHEVCALVEKEIDTREWQRLGRRSRESWPDTEVSC